MIIAADDHAAFMARVSADLLADPGDEKPFDRLVNVALGLVPGVDHASLTVPARHGARTLAWTSEVASKCDALQYELGEGPCVEAMMENDWFRSGDIASDPRWPTWGPRAAAQGVASLVSVRLAVHEHPVGALNLYSDERDQFADADTLDVVFLYALHAAAALSAVKEITGLRTGMQNRHTIGVAQGILMQRYGLTLERSFELLRRYSTSRNIKLRDVAAHVIEHQALPDAEPSPATEERAGE